MPKSVDEQILERLDQILKVLSLSVAADQSLTERVRLLKLAGLDNMTHTNAPLVRRQPATRRTGLGDPVRGRIAAWTGFPAGVVAGCGNG